MMAAPTSDRDTARVIRASLEDERDGLREKLARLDEGERAAILARNWTRAARISSERAAILYALTRLEQRIMLRRRAG